MSNIYSQEAEKALLGCMILSSEAASDYIAHLSDEDFEFWMHKSIINALIHLYKSNMPIDMITLSESISALATDNQKDCFAYIATLCSDFFITSSVKHYFDIVKEKSARRIAIRESRKFIDALMTNEDAPFEQLYHEHDRTVSKIIESKSSNDMFEPLEPILTDFLTKMGTAEDESNVIVDSTIPKVNELTNFFRGGQLIVIAADTGIGKSTFAMQIATNHLLNGAGNVLFMSFEMKVKEMTCRIMSYASGVNYHDLYSNPNNLKDDDWRRILESYQRLQDKVCGINTVYSTELDKIQFEVNKYIKQYQAPQLIVVDYISLIKADQKLNKVQQVTMITNYLKNLAMEHNCVVLAVQQMNRAHSARSGEEAAPRLSDLKDSSSVEQDADAVIFLHREARHLADNASSTDIMIKVAKSRHGREGSCFVYHDGAKMRFLAK